MSVCLTLELFLSLIQPSEFITSNKTCLGILKKNVNSMRQKFSSVLFPNVEFTVNNDCHIEDTQKFIE